MVNKANHILLTIDVEDWFQVENYKPWIAFSAWPNIPMRVEANVERILDLLDSWPGRANSNERPGKIEATFFVLGWIARRRPGLIRKIAERGHEIASHGLNHQLCSELSAQQLRADLTDSKKLLEDIIGAPVNGYRAPSFSISHKTLDLVRETGFRYDSSYNSFSLHGRYGSCTKCQQKSNGRMLLRLAPDFYELPVSNLNINGFILPWGGGCYFRLMPLNLFKIGVQYILRHSTAYVLYLHPWEFDPQQPRLSQASAMRRFRHLNNIRSTHRKLKDLIKYFRSCRFISCSAYIADNA